MTMKKKFILFIPIVIVGVVVISMMQLLDESKNVAQTNTPVSTKKNSILSASSDKTTSTPSPTENPHQTTTPTYTSTPIPTSTPEPWKSYRIVYSFEWEYFPSASKLWIPIPNKSTGFGMRNVNIESIQPEPDDLYQDIHGNLIAYWGDSFRHYQTYNITFTVDLAPININIHPEDIQIDDPFWGLAQQEYELYSQANFTIPSDDERFIALAQEIVGDETNPWRQIQLIQRFVFEYFNRETPCSISGTDPYPYSIIGAYERKCGGCGEYSGLFVTLLRTLGIPARNIGGIVHEEDQGGEFPGGSIRESTLGFHVWSEVYLPPYGWIQIDTTGLGFHMIKDLRLIFFRGEDINLEHDPPFGPIPNFHYPFVNAFIGGGWPGYQTWGKRIELMVNELP